MNKKIIDDLLQYGERVTLECKKAETALPKSVWETYSALDLLIADNKGRWTTYKLNSEYNQSRLSNGLSNELSNRLSNELSNRLSNELSNRLSNELSNGLSNGLSESESTTLSILSLIRENPYITRKEIASKIGISLTAIQKHINKLKFNNQIKREGPATRGGYWIVLSE